MATKAEELATGCLSRVQPGEPVFVLRGQDLFAGETVRLWARTLCEFQHGMAHHPAQCPSPKVAEAVRLARQMDEWPTRKVPD